MRAPLKLLIFVFLLAGVSPVLTPRPPGANTKPQKRVLALLSTDSTIYEEALAGVQSVLRSRLEVEYLTVLRAEQGDLGVYFERRAPQLEMVIALGPAAATAAYKYLRHTPVIFSMVASPRNLKTGGRPLCGVSMHVPVNEYLRTLREINPRARRVVAFYSTPEGEYLAREGEYFDAQNRQSYRIKKVAPGEFEQSLRRLKGRADAFYMLPDALYNRRRFLKLSAYCRENGIILMTSFRRLVRAGATFGFSPDHNKNGRISGEMANRLLAGAGDCREEGVHLPDRSSYFFYVNEGYARRARTKIPEQIRERARRVRIFKAGINFLNEGKLKAARVVFEAFLKRDPENRTANYYYEQVLEKLIGGQVRELMEAARIQMKNGRYARAQESFKKALAINPRLGAARRGNRRAAAAWSEQETGLALKLAEKGRRVDAIKHLTTALRLRPGHRVTQNYLRRFRALEAPRVPERLQGGIQLYNRRDYKNSIRVFRNILVVQPGNKKAREYLRLSLKKKQAITRLRDKIRRRKSR